MAYMQRILSNRGIFIADVKKSRQSINQWRSKFSAQKIITLSISKKIRNRSVRAPSSYPTGAAYIQMHLKRIRNTFQKLWEDLQRFFFEGLLHRFPTLLRGLTVAKKTPSRVLGMFASLTMPHDTTDLKAEKPKHSEQWKMINVQKKLDQNRINEYPAKKNREIYRSKQY